MRNILGPLLLSATFAACAPAGGVASGPVPLDTIIRPMLRPVPLTHAYRAALASGTRDSSGAPGQGYWQQSVAYRIEATLDPQTTELRGREWVTYRNRSPQTLNTVVLNLYQNIFTETARRNRVAANTGGVTLERVAVDGAELRPVATGRIGVTSPVQQPASGYEIAGTLARLTLPRPLAPGDSLRLEIAWHHRIPPAGTFRTAWEEALGGRAFNVAQWYPQIATYDDVNGWDATPYLGDGEFYLEYGDFDVSISVPTGHLVGATGTLLNPAEVLAPGIAARLASGDSIVHVVTRADRAAGAVTTAGNGGQVTWRFRAERVRDFAFATSDQYLWDMARASVPGGPGEPERRVPVHAFYRPGAANWEQAAGFGRHAIDFFSRRLIPYLYPQVTIAEGPIGGMEYPMLVFIPRPADATDLQSVIAHEVGHEWFPMMIGQDEASYAWMDEGFTSFNENEAVEDRFPELDPHGGSLAAYLRVAGRDNEVPLMRHTDLVSPYGARTVAAYSKPAVMLVALRGILGQETFDRAMRTYATEWLFRHPQPWDFFATVERVAGRDLDWFWYPWWFETGTLDLAITSAVPADGGIRITVQDRGDIPAPAVVRATTAEGLTSELEIPIGAWTQARTRSATFTLPSAGRVVRVELDPAGTLPDVDRNDNVWTAP